MLCHDREDCPTKLELNGPGRSPEKNMQDQLYILLLIGAFLCGLGVLWALTIGITYWDVTRRNLAGRWSWLALVIVLPGLGFGVYLLARIFELWSFNPDGEREQLRRRVTMVKRQEPLTGRGDTIPAVELRSPTSAVAPGQVIHQGQPLFQLEVIAGPHQGQAYLLEWLPVKIGRGHEAQIRLDNDLGVSRLHAEFYEQAGVIRLRDLKSTHGTQVNGFNIDDKGLDAGDQIQVGVSTLRVGHKEAR